MLIWILLLVLGSFYAWPTAAIVICWIGIGFSFIKLIAELVKGTVKLKEDME